MLGRQQIAGIPTAISELFKNAHDAYARHVEVDYFRDDGLFVLRDDGLGMTRQDFEKRWLTLGTDSKVGSDALRLPPIDPSQPKRPILGEKGIGRLAIAIIGPQVLALSRAKLNHSPSDTIVAAYIHWGVFELSGLSLDEIEIPVREFPARVLPGMEEIRAMVDEMSTTLDSLSAGLNAVKIDEIRKEMEKFTLDPREYAEFLDGPSLTESGCGTHFYIIPANEIINDDIDNREASNKATLLEKTLIGFTNTMTPGGQAPTIITRFRDHVDEGSPVELVGERVFFTPEEFNNVDHHFHGRFDDYGQFKGTVGIYQMEPEPYTLNWCESDGQKTLCGPFSLSFAYMQGAQRDSLLEPYQHARLKRKLDRYGGLYIYRDGIRIQPYGDSDYDWLNIERNRTLSAGYYFYSYRRMFGVVQLSKEENHSLQEKAGREGFRENKAYRQLRSILMNFFVQTAGDFFRDDGKYSEPHLDIRKELNKNEEIRKKKAKQVQSRRRKFQVELEEVFKKIDDQVAEGQSDVILAELTRELNRLLGSDRPPKSKAIGLIRLEREAREKLHRLRNDMVVSKPKGVGLTRAIEGEWSAYISHLKRLDSQTFLPTEQFIEEIVTTSAGKEKIPLEDIARLNTVVVERGDDVMGTIRAIRRTIDEMANNIVASIKQDTSESLKAVNLAVDSARESLDHLKREAQQIHDITETRSELVGPMESVYEKELRKLEILQAQLMQLDEFRKDGYSNVELTEALEEEVEALKSRHDIDLELAQIGLALNTISHEFEKSVGSLRRGLDRLEAWAVANPEMNALYQSMRISFDHLDEYLSLFTPLDKRLYRNQIDISGKHIYEFLGKLFQTRIARHGIDFRASDAFKASSIHCYPSSLYPPFVNLIDNSIYWLQSNHNRPREIVLDSDEAGLLIMDNGPGVSARDQENIFRMNFSRKPGGRGMGLNISRETLSRVGFALTLEPGPISGGAVFRISKKA